MAADLSAPDVVDALGRQSRGVYVDQPDLTAQLDERRRLSEIGADAPGVGVACQLLSMFSEPPIPISPKSGEPLGPPLSSMTAVADLFAELPRSHLAVRTGPRGSWSLVGLEYENTGELLGWITEVCGVLEEFRDSSDSLASRGHYREYGRPGAAVWRLPSHPPIAVSGVVRGTDPAFRSIGQALRDRGRPVDKGGTLLFRVPLDRGRPRFPGRRISNELHVRADGDLVAVYATRQGGWVKDLIGWPQAPSDASPAWFASELGAR